MGVGRLVQGHTYVEPLSCVPGDPVGLAEVLDQPIAGIKDTRAQQWSEKDWTGPAIDSNNNDDDDDDNHEYEYEEEEEVEDEDEEEDEYQGFNLSMKDRPHKLCTPSPTTRAILKAERDAEDEPQFDYWKKRNPGLISITYIKAAEAWGRPLVKPRQCRREWSVGALRSRAKCICRSRT